MLCKMVFKLSHNTKHLKNKQQQPILDAPSMAEVSEHICNG